MCNLLDSFVALGCICYEGCEGHGTAMGYCNLEWNWPKEAVNRPIGQEFLIEPTCFNLLVNTYFNCSL